MTIDTIKDVLGRIISINKNLTEESLRNLLVASGWDNTDIEEGMRVYRNRGASVEASPSISIPSVAPIAKPEINNNVATPVQAKETVQSTSDMIHAAESMLKAEEEKKAEAIASVPSAAVPIVEEETKKTFPIAVLIVDVGLFLIALALLVYILTR